LAQLKDKVQNALDEARMLILGANLLLGFQLRSFLEKGFETLPLVSRALKLGGLGLLLIALALLVAPTAYHRIVERGEDTEELHAYTSRVMTFALLPFALALGIDVYVAAAKIAGSTVGALAGVFAAFAALFFWYGLEAVPRGGGGGERAGARKGGGELEPEDAKPVGEGAKKEEDEGAKTKDKIRHVLTEARMVLPGAQALLGFQFVTILMESFDKLPASSKYVHLASLSCVALSIVLLMTPAAYHRIVERGELTEHFYGVASRLLVAAMIPLALGINGSLYVVLRKVTNSVPVSIVAAAAGLLFFYGLWFGFTAYRRGQRRAHARTHESAPRMKAV